MGKTTSRRIFTTAATALIAGGISVAGTAANATTDPMTVTSATAPVWLSNHAVPVAVAVSNPASNFLCNPVEVKLVWFSAGGHRHAAYRSGAAMGGVYAGTINIPARTVWPGMLRYRVIAHQTCGLMQNHLDRYRATSPSSGWASTTIR
jgi:hypothetical protein